ncbi:hypothetical protein [Flavihumibacter fluvii]|uniref:hypothetical protein n=1 Tax=Flavihumibacter fluvii TaxID=2838157 RepID=UPI001BDEE1C1|nr:hypothetical protein [Flavihumibacter fluvii]ULQ52698.1 hypothetical protein KJS93_21655 [Flavihumibacter fluvii]
MFRFNHSLRKFAPYLLLTAGVITCISWTGTVVHSSGLNYDLYAADTIPENPQSLEEQIRQLEKAQQNLQRELSQKDWNKIEAEMENAIGRINTKEIDAQMQKAMAELDRSMVQIDKDQLLRKIDIEMIQAELSKTQQELEKEFSKQDWQKELKLAQEEMQKAMKEVSAIDQKQLKEELARVKSGMKISFESMANDLAKAKKEMQENKFKIKESLDEARKELEKTRREYMGYRTMIGEMQKEGLITDPQNYQVEFRDGDLFINEKKQPASVTNRYRKFFHNKPILLKNENDRFETED